MSESDSWTIHTDGAARGNPGPAAYAFTLERPGLPIVEEKSVLPNTTNNVAEYTALVKSLEKARELGGRRLLVLSDSELMVKQMEGIYRVKNEGLRSLFDRASALVRTFDSVEMRHIRREQNKRADALCNQALDGDVEKPAPAKAHATAKAPKPARSANLPADAAADVLECLRAAACAWSAGNPNVPRAEEVWDQLWSIVEESGILRKASQ